MVCRCYERRRPPQVLVGLATLWAPPSASRPPLASRAAHPSAGAAARQWRRVRLRGLQLTATLFRALAARAGSAGSSAPSAAISAADAVPKRSSRQRREKTSDAGTPAVSDGEAPTAAGPPAGVSASVCTAAEHLLPLLLPIASGVDALLAAVAIDCLRALAAAHAAAFGSTAKISSSEPRRQCSLKRQRPSNKGNSAFSASTCRQMERCKCAQTSADRFQRRSQTSEAVRWDVTACDRV